ncbi:hypothetical protein D3C85_1896420 [compost metagenome]
MNFVQQHRREQIPMMAVVPSPKPALERRQLLLEVPGQFGDSLLQSGWRTLDRDVDQAVRGVDQ